jgi:hypothetical protein
MSAGPVMFRRIPVAPSIEDSSPAAPQRGASLGHDRPHVGEVEVDDAGHRDQVGDALHALAEDVVGYPKRLDDRRPLLDHLEQTVVLDHDQRVDLLAELLDSTMRLLGPPPALETERPGDEAEGQRPQLLSDLGNDRRAAGPGPAALAGGDEDHIGALQDLFQLVAALVRRVLADLWIRPGPQPLRRLRSDLHLHIGIDDEQRLCVGVRRHELDAAETRIHHAVDGVRTAAADAHDLDHRQVVASLVTHAQRPSTSSSTLAPAFSCATTPQSKAVQPSCQTARGAAI